MRAISFKEFALFSLKRGFESMISYDKKTRHLMVSSGEVVTFDIQLRSRISVVRGAAATGKNW